MLGKKDKYLKNKYDPSIFTFQSTHVTSQPDEERTCKLTGNLKLHLKISGTVNTKEKIKTQNRETFKKVI